jgi:hypothetical protein
MADAATNLISENDYQIVARNVHLTSRVSQPGTGASELYLSSTGAGAPHNNGSIRIEANKYIGINCGKAHVRMSDAVGKSGVSLGSDGEGATEIWQGSSPGSAHLRLAGPSKPAATIGAGTLAKGSYLSVRDDKLSLASGPPKVGASIEMSGQDLTLKFAAGSIAFTAAGIEIAVGTNKITVGVKGIELNGMLVDIQAMTKLSTQALQISESATAMWDGSPSAIKQL